MKIYNLQSNPSMYIEDYGRKVVEVNPTTINNQNLKLQKEDKKKKTIKKSKNSTSFHEILVDDMEKLGMTENEIGKVLKKKL